MVSEKANKNERTQLNLTLPTHEPIHIFDIELGEEARALKPTMEGNYPTGNGCQLTGNIFFCKTDH